MNWIQLVAARIWNNLIGAGMPESKARKVLDEELPEVIAATEAGRGFGAQPEDAPSKQKEEEPLVRGEKLEVLRKKARAWAGWEPWISG